MLQFLLISDNRKRNAFLSGYLYRIILVGIFLGGISVQTLAQVSGTVYRDFNGNGTLQSTAAFTEPGVPGIEVRAYNSANVLVATTTTGNAGTYTLSGTGNLRIEFTIPGSGSCAGSAFDFTGVSGDGNNIRFVTAPFTGLNYAINSPEDYVSSTNPKVFMPIFSAGDPLVAGTAGSKKAFVAYYYSAGPDSTSWANALNASSIGSVWGVAYSKQANKIFTAAFLKRHAGLGPLGSGGIYLLTPSGTTFTVTNFYNMDANGFRTRAAASAPAYGNGNSYTLNGTGTSVTYNGSIDAESGYPSGLGVIGTNTQRGMTGDVNWDTYDPAAFDQIGKVGLGDIEISDDGKYLFVMNLYSRKLYRLQLNDPYNPTSVIAVTSYAIPNYAVSNGVLRPFAVSYYRGRLFIGTVASGENGGSNTINGATNLYAHVFELNNPTGSAGFNSTPILSFPLNYRKGFPITTLNTDTYKKWNPWSKVSDVLWSDGYEHTYCSPMLSNIEFTDRGDMVLDFMDRGGHQYSNDNLRDLGISAVYAYYDISGDVLIAGRNCATNSWTLESNGSYTSSGTTFSSAGVANTEGPGNGEFFYQDYPPDEYHHETSQGACAILNGTRSGVFTLMDADTAFSGGTAIFSTLNGTASARGVAYGFGNGDYGKANGLGDVELAGSEPPIEIGNRVWLDANDNGIQDAGETGIANVGIQLFCDFDNNGIPDGAAIATTTTNAQGEWYFNQSNVTDGDCSVSGSQAGVRPNKTYLVRIAGTDWSGGVGIGDLAGRYVTITNATVNGIMDASDNDAALVSGIPQISITTSSFGVNSHLYDFGFTDCLADAGPDKTLNCSTPSTTIGTPAIAGGTYSWSPATGLSSATVAQPTASPAITTTYIVTVNGSCKDTVIVTVNKTPPTADAGTTKNLDCNTTSATIGTTAIAGNSYTWSPATGLSATNIAQPTANPTTTTIYTVTVTGTNGCTATDVVTINVNTTTPTVMISGDPFVCNGSQTTLTASGGSTYNWSSGSITDTTIVSAGTYTVTVTGSNGCISIDSATVNVAEGTIGNYVWEDINKNGLNDEPLTAGINGITVELWKENPAGSNNYILDQTTITDDDGSSNPGYYTFIVCDSSNYKVKFPIQSGALMLTTPTSTPGVDNNSDPNTIDGLTASFTIDPKDTGLIQNNMTLDAGYFATACIGNYVWNDLNQNGLQDPTEVGVAGITVTLYNGSDQIISSTVTDAYGNYQFCGLTPGDYKVAYTLPSNYIFSPGNAGSNDSLDSDADENTGWTSIYTLSSGDFVNTVDAGIYFEPIQTSTIGNFVWLDLNQDGIQDTGETGISGVTVTLYDNSNNTIATTITDANGYYQFTNVDPGTYVIGITTPAGLTNSPNTGGINIGNNSDINPTTGQTSTFTLAGGEIIDYVDAGFYSLPNTVGSLGDLVWNDMNQNGLQDPDEPGVSGVTVTLYQSDGVTVISTTVTNTYGNYIFNNLPAGSYVVGFSNIASGYILTGTGGSDTTKNSDANTLTGKTAVIVLGSGQHNATIDAGIYTTLSANSNSIGNLVWNDLNSNGIQEAGESGVPGITVHLYDAVTDNLLKTISTDANGHYLFADLPNGTYYVGFSNLPLNHSFTLQGIGTTSNDSDPNPSTGLSGVISLTGNTHDSTLDAGIHPGNMNIGPGSIGDKVWYDLNGDGMQNANEKGVSGIMVILYGADGITGLDTTYTNALGHYMFTGLDEGNYVIGFSGLPAGYTISPKDADAQGLNGSMNSDVNPATGKTDIINLAPGEDKLTVDMGVIPPAGLAGLGNYVWYDLNSNGLQNSGEPGVQGVTVTLYDINGAVITTTTTDQDGAYQFIGLAPGTYSVGFGNLPSGYSFTQKDADTQGLNGPLNSDADINTGLTGQVTLAANEYNMNLDAGIISNIVASVGNFVWNDLNRDGLQDTTEPGINGILVTLYDSLNNPVASTITGADGGYIFTNVLPGTYSIGFSNLPGGMTFTTQETNLNSDAGSNVDPGTGFTPTFTLIAGDYNPTIDAGLLTILQSGLGNYVWYDANENGIQEAGEPAVTGVIATLYAANGTTVLGTSITNGNGIYGFTNLPEGTYIVGFSNLPPGASPTISTGGINVADNSDMNPTTYQTAAVTLAPGEFNPNLDAGIRYGTPLPLHLQDFDLMVKDCQVELNWSTTWEEQVSHFEVMRKEENRPYETIGIVRAQGESNTTVDYRFVDSAIENDKVYTYKLQIIDKDENRTNTTESHVVIQCDRKGTITMYPNPVSDIIYLETDFPENRAINVVLLNINGQTIYREDFKVKKGKNQLSISAENLASGHYILEVHIQGLNSQYFNFLKY